MALRLPAKDNNGNRTTILRLQTFEKFTSDFSYAADRVRRAFDQHDRAKLEEAVELLRKQLVELIAARADAERRAREADEREFKMLLITVIGVLVAIASLIVTLVAVT